MQLKKPFNIRYCNSSGRRVRSIIFTLQCLSLQNAFESNLILYSNFEILNPLLTMDPGLNQLLKWSVANSPHSINDSSVARTSQRELNPNAINALFGGVSDAELMVSSMAVIRSSDPQVSLEDRIVAFDNFEQLIESLDNANNLEPTDLWSPLLECLDHKEGEIRMMAAWCVGTAVQNNRKSQEILANKGGLPKLLCLATSSHENTKTQRKAVYALSSACRNYQPAMDLLISGLQKMGRDQKAVDASDMDACDELMNSLRHNVAK